VIVTVGATPEYPLPALINEIAVNWPEALTPETGKDAVLPNVKTPPETDTVPK
jgi:hypothetical protein